MINFKNSDFCKLLRVPISSILKIQSFHLTTVDFWPKIFLILYLSLENSTTSTAKNLSNFVSLPWKLHNREFHIVSHGSSWDNNHFCFNIVHFYMMTRRLHIKELQWDTLYSKQTNKQIPKAELPKVGIFFALNFLLWEFLLIKKLEIEKTKTTFILSVLKVVYWVVLVFSISNFFINKNSQGRKLSAKTNTYFR